METKQKIIKLTKANIDRLPTLEARYDVFDTEVPGLILRVGTRKRVFIYRYEFGSVRRAYTIGDYGTFTPDQARKKLTNYAVLFSKA